MVCDVCGCVTGHMTLKKPPQRPHDECQRCYWMRELCVADHRAQRIRDIVGVQWVNMVMIATAWETEKIRVSTWIKWAGQAQCSACAEDIVDGRAP